MYTKMNIAVATNEKYLKLVMVALISLIKNNRIPIRIFFMYLKLSHESRNAFIKRFSVFKNVEVNFIEIEKEQLSGVTANWRLTKEAYIRLIMEKKLPIDVTKILWMDADIIIQGSIFEFYKQNIDEYYAVVCRDMGAKHYILEREATLGLDKSSGYFNSGFMLFNIDKIRKDFKNGELVKWARNNTNIIRFADQDVFNVLFFNKVKYVSARKYNYQLATPNAKLLDYYKAKVLHYNTQYKPNDYRYFLNHKLAWEIFWKYAITIYGIRGFSIFLIRSRLDKCKLLLKFCEERVELNK